MSTVEIDAGMTYEFAGATHIAVTVDAQGLPTLYVNGERHSGQLAVFDRRLPIEQIRAHVDAYLTRVKPPGTPS